MRSQKSIQVELKADLKKKRLVGYASVFGNLDRGFDVVHKGAFERTLRERLSSGGIVVKRNHRNLIGKPIGASEDSAGLMTESEISLTSGELGGKNTLQLIADGALTKMSFQYRAKKWEFEETDKGLIRHLHDVDLFEYGPVDQPMNEAAQITGLKGLGDLHELLSQLPENFRWLSRQAQYSEAEKALAGQTADRFLALGKELKGFLAHSEPDNKAASRLLDLIRNRRDWANNLSEA